MAVWGYGQGLIAGGLSLVGFAAGAFIGSRLGPLLLEDGLALALRAAVRAAGRAADRRVARLGLRGARLPPAASAPRARRAARRPGGGVLVACLGLFLVWIGGAVALQTPGARDLREPIQRSAILKELNKVLPPSGPILQALARFDPFPSITGPSANVRRAGHRRSHAILRWRRARRSVVRVLGTACGLGVQGSGWVAGRGIVVTNAHVVAGQDDTAVQVGGEGPELDAEAIWFDPRNDLSILRVPGATGAAGAADERERRVRHGGRGARVPRERPVQGGAGEDRRDVHGRHAGCLRARPVERTITSLRGVVRPGNSAARRWTGRGASSPRSSPRPRAAAHRLRRPGLDRPCALERARGTVDTGPCAR